MMHRWGQRSRAQPPLRRKRRLSLSPFADIRFLSLDDCQYALQPTIPGLTRSRTCIAPSNAMAYPACQIEGDKPAKDKFKKYPIGNKHIDIAEVQTEEGRLYLFVAIDRTSKYAYTKLHECFTKLIAADSYPTCLKPSITRFQANFAGVTNYQ